MSEFGHEPPRGGYRMVTMAAAWAAGMTMVGLIVGGGAEQLASAVSTPATNVAAADRPEYTRADGSAGIDYTATGEIRGQPKLDPCHR